MVDSVKCKNCGKLLEIDFKESADERVPCPECGSTFRDFQFSTRHQININDGVVFADRTNITTTIPSLLIQTVVEKGDKTDDGEVILAVTLPWYHIIAELMRDPEFAYRMTPRMWEEMVAGIYERAGFDEVILTPHSADHGRDVIAVKKGVGIIRVIDQVKAFKPPHRVKADDVRALLGVLRGDGASKGFLTTTSDFAPTLREDPLIKPFLGNTIELVSGDMLLTRLKELSANKP